MSFFSGFFDISNFVYGWGKWMMDKLSPREPNIPGRAPQTSIYGTPLPLVYGRTRITGNVIMCSGVVDGDGDFRVMIAICEGPIAGVNRLWHDGAVVFPTAPEMGFAVDVGTRPTQTAWGFSQGGLGYPGVAILRPPDKVSPFGGQLLSQGSFEVQGMLDATGDAANGDAQPADILKGSVASPASSMLCEPNFGVGFPFSVETDIGRDGNAASSYRRYVTAQGLWISPAFLQQRPAFQQLKEVLDSTNATCLWGGITGGVTGGVLEIVPLGDQSVTGNSVTYTPVTTIQYALTKDDFIAQSDGRLVAIELGPSTDVYNIAPVEFLERAPTAVATDPANAYNAAVEEDPDPVDAATRGALRAPIVQLHSICQRSVALTISRIRAQRMSQSRFVARFTLPWRFARLQPLDFVTIEDKLLGLSPPVPVRIESIEEDPSTYNLDIEASEWPFGIGNALPHTTQSSDSGLPPAGDDPEQRRHEMALRNWIAVSVPTGAWKAITWSPELSLFVAVGTNCCATSPDGIAWTARTIPNATWNAVAWSASLTLFVAVGAGGACASSPDGITWTTRTIGAGSWTAVRWNGSIFCAVGQSGGICATSSNGTTWTTRTMTAGSWNGLTWNGALWVAVGGGGSTVTASSPDAITWTGRLTSAVANLLTVEWGTPWFVAVGTKPGGGACWRSLDGISWTEQTVPTMASSAVLRTLIWTGRIFAVLDDSSTAQGGIITSRDGSGWTVLNTRLPHVSYSGMVWSGRMACAVGSAGSGNAAISLAL